jgi:2-polyprenyl-3-methyl-5-hydroxy-6-metoxy-1,4-benzoquinol methylase
MSNSQSNNCRLCGTLLSEKPVIKLENVPRGAHVFPTAEQLDEDFTVNLDIYQCSSCGLVQLGGESVIYADQVTSAHGYSPKMLEHRRQQAHDFVTQFHLQGKKAIEVGCGDGHFMELLEEMGVEAFGVEPSAKSAELGIKKGLKIQPGYLRKNSLLKDASFDAFVTMHVLEHIPNPNEFLQAIHENLNPGAVGLIEIPSFEIALERQRVYDFLVDHLSYFTVKTLKLALETNGFEVLHIERNWDGEHIVAKVQKQEQNSLNMLSESVQQLGQQLNEFTDSYVSVGKGVAIWGASHHGMTLLSLTKPQGLAYVVDSSPHKQGRFTPAFHLPIVPPSRLLEEPVGAVIIMAHRFSDEITQQLQGEMNFKGAIAVLSGNKLKIVN